MRFSANKLSTAMDCQRQFKFRYIDELEIEEPESCYTSFGSVVHLVLEMVDGGILEPRKAVDTFISAWDSPSKYGIPDPEWYPPRVTHKTLRKRGIEAVRRYVDGLSWRERQVVAVEHEFLVPCGDHELYGFVDLLELTRSKSGELCLRIVDHKTSKTVPDAAALAANVQFTIYDWASRQKEFWTGRKYVDGLENGEQWFEETKDLPRLLVWHAITQGKEVDCGERTKEDYGRMRVALDEVAKAVERDVFVPNISGENCGWCRFKEPCGLYVPENAGEDW